MWKSYISQIIYFSVSTLGGHWSQPDWGGGRGAGGVLTIPWSPVNTSSPDDDDDDDNCLLRKC